MKSRGKTQITWQVLRVYIALEDWPDFRGAGQNGHAAPLGIASAPSFPLIWSETNNVVWKTPIPHRGWSTPVIQGKQIWLTTVTPDGHDFFGACVDVDSGKIISTNGSFTASLPNRLATS